MAELFRETNRLVEVWSEHGRSAEQSGLFTPELIVDENSYHGGPIVTGGQRLYWIDRRHDRILGMSRSAASLPEHPALVAKTIDAKDLPANIASADSKVLVGDGWGCANIFLSREQHL